MDDRELTSLLHEWRAPDAPPHLRPPGPILPRQDARWWKWLLTGTIRVPVPVGIVIALLTTVWLYSNGSVPEPDAAVSPQGQAVVTLADFQPVAEVELRVIGDAK